MSYILDALQKSQAEQAGERDLPGPQRYRAQRGWGPITTFILCALLALNAGLLGWFLWSKDTPQTATTAPDTLAPPAIVAAPAIATTPAIVATPEPSFESEIQAPPPVATAAVASAILAQSADRPLTRVSLADLPAPQQEKYNRFNYTTHIYTDDPALCAIVIDGQRLRAGDTIKGLRVAAITEAGVVFADTVGGVPTEVVVDLQQQWGQ